jgi:folate-binding protein YgfZ
MTERMPIEHLINKRILTSNHSIEDELNIQDGKNYLFDLSHLGLLELSGVQTLDFLQGQLTCDVKSISNKHMIQGAQCNLKGRILSLVDILDWNGIKLVLPQDIINHTVNSLGKTAQLSRVTMNKTHEFKILGFLLQDASDLIPGQVDLLQDMYSQESTLTYCIYHLGNGFYVLIVPKNREHEYSDEFVGRGQYFGSLTWHTLRLIHRQIDIYPESRGLFLTQRLGLHQTKLISFNKGCYKGQEIIARTHYKGTVKHELKIFNIHSNTPPFSGQKLFKPSSNVELGELIDYSYLGNNHYLVAVSILKNSIQTVCLEGQSESVILDSASLPGNIFCNT